MRSLAVLVALACALIVASAASAHGGSSGAPGVKRLGTAGADRLVGTARADRLSGRGGADRLSGRGGADRLIGGYGADRLYGHGGADRLDAGPGNDLAEGGAGADRISGNSGRDRLYGQAGHDSLYAADGTADARVDGGSGNDVCVIDAAERAQTRNCEEIVIVDEQSPAPPTTPERPSDPETPAEPAPRQPSQPTPTTQPPPSEPAPASPTPAPARLGVFEREWSLTLSRTSVVAGPVIIDITNLGEDPHNLWLRKGTTILSGPEIEPGQSATWETTLTAGTWTVYCELPGHESAGMRATLTAN